MSFEDAKIGSTSYNVAKLNEENYRSQKTQIEFILDEFGCLELVEEKEAILTAPAVAGGSHQIGFEAKLDAWTRRNKKACSTIITTCSSSVLVYLESIKNPVRMQKTLEDKFLPKTATTRFQVMKEFIELKAKDESEVEVYIQRLTTLKMRPEEQGEKVSDTAYNSVFMSSVEDLEDYKSVISTLEFISDLKLETIINRFLEVYKKQYSVENENEKVTLFSGKASKKLKSSKKDVKCSACEKTGHSEDKC